MRVILTEVEIAAGIAQLARRIAADYEGRPLTILGVLTGSLIFLSDLIRQLDLPLKVGLIQAASYRGRTTQAGRLAVGDLSGLDISGRHVLLLDDIFDTGQTLSRLTTELQQLGPFRGHGTSIYFEPDPDIFKTTQLDASLIRSHLEDMSYIHSGLKITFKNEVTKETFDLTHPGGIPEFLGRLVVEGQKAAVTETPFTVARGNGEKMEVALQWTEATDEAIRSYVNGIRTL